MLKKRMVKIFYVSPCMELKKQSANAIAMLKMCESLSSLNAVVVLIIPEQNCTKEEIEYLYGIKIEFKIIWVKRRKSIPEKRQVLDLINVLVLKKFLKHSDIIYTRSVTLPIWLFLSRNKIVIEIHQKRYINNFQTFFYNYSLKLLMFFDVKKKIKIITITKIMGEWIKNYFKINDSRIFVFPSAFDPNQKSKKMKVPHDMERFLKLKRPICLYAGKLSDDKGILNIIKLASKMGEMNFIIIGGFTEEINIYKQLSIRCSNLYFLGNKIYSKVYEYLKYADYLLILNDIKMGIINDVLSPIKLYEYMAAGKVIVASDLPSIREIIKDGYNGLLVDPSQPEVIKYKLLEIEKDKNIKRQLGFHAYNDVKQYTWRNRAEEVLKFINL